MTSTIRRFAGGVTILEAVWILYMYYTSKPGVASCPSRALGCPTSLNFFSSLTVAALAVILVVVGGLGIWGASFAYVVGAVFSGISLVFMGIALFQAFGYPNLSTEVTQAIMGTGLAIIAIVGNAIASRKRERLSEQANPMNLPVFG